jgi:protein-L-isoaspartate(D-aspartate) O-methyltransferase
MSAETDLFADARRMMVDSQIRPNRVSDPRILAAMRRLPRERFLPPSAVPLAYTDEDIPLGNGRYLMEPMVFARLLQAATLHEQERVLVIAAGTGYGAAVLAACGCRVVALEEDPALLEVAGTLLPEFAPGVTLVSGSLAAGWPSHAPYDLILIEGAVQDIPAALASQLHQETGRLLAPVCRDGCATRAVQAEMTAASLGLTTIFDCGTPPLPSLRRASAFQF